MWWLVVPFTSSEYAAPLLLCGAVGALLPDLDSPRSLLTAWKIAGFSPLLPLARVVNRTFGHRGMLHSLLGWAIASAGFTLLILFPLWSARVSLALSFGYLSHLAADACTKTGIPFFYPRRLRYRLLPKPLRFTTGSLAEDVLFTCLSILLVFGLINSLLAS